MPGWCPYLEQGDGRKQMGTADPHYRCCVRFPAERVGRVYQTQVCSTPEYHHCSRLISSEPRDEPVSAHAAWARPSVRRPEVAAVGRGREQQQKRPITFIEITVMSLVVAILFTCLFVGYALFYRLRVGPGMGAAPIMAERAGPTPTQMRPTLVPTFTPTPLPTSTPPATDEPSLPTPIPEPTLPAPTAIVRLPAASPPTRLVIPKVAIDVPVLSVGTKVVREGNRSTLVWADVPNAGGFHETSAYPGNLGNTVINGHRDILGSVFRRLNEVDVGDEVVLYVGEEAYAYQVVETLILPETFASAEQRAENLKYIGYMPEERLTLVTCTPVGLATHRLLIIAKPPGQIDPQMPEAGSTPGP